MSVSLVHCNGAPADAAALAAAALVNYGHFTSLQLRGGRAQGLDLHLRRLADATEALFAATLDQTRLRQWLRVALADFGQVDASVRITVFSRDFDFRDPLRAVAPDVLMALSPPSTIAGEPLRVMPVRALREFPQFKHVGTFPLFQHRRLARQAGFDDILLVSPDDGRIAEGAVWNLGLWDGQGVTWPDGPALEGTQQQLLQQGLTELGVTQQVRALRLDDLEGFRAGFACNSRGQQALAAIGGHRFAEIELPGLLELALRTRPWQAP